MSDWQVELVEDNMQEFHVWFQGPSESEYLFVRDGLSASYMG